MKKIKTIAALAVALVLSGVVAKAADVLRVQGAGPQPFTLIQSFTTDVSETYKAITNNTSCAFSYAIIDCTKGENVCIQIVASLSGAGTTANTLTLQGSVDKSDWASNVPITVPSIAWTPAGTAAVITVTNIPVIGIPYLRVATIANANANTGAITNYSVKYFVK